MRLQRRNNNPNRVTLSAVRPELRFAAATVALNVAIAWIHRAVHSPVVDAAIAADLVLTNTVLYYLIVIRSGARSNWTLLPIALLGLLRAAFLVPGTIPGKAWIGGGLEISFVSFVAWHFIRTRSIHDPIARLQAATAAIIPSATGARLLAGELSVLYYALFAWRAKPDVPAGAEPFTLHKQAAMPELFACVALASIFEIVPVHMGLALWSHTAAWIATGLSLYGMIWLIGIARSFSLRPSLFTPEGIWIRYGLLYSLYIPGECLQRTSGADFPARPKGAAPTIQFAFTHPLEATVALGFKREVTGIGLRPDGSLVVHQLSTIFPEFPDSMRSNAASNSSNLNR